MQCQPGRTEMKITRRQLNRIILKELGYPLNEGLGSIVKKIPTLFSAGEIIATSKTLTDLVGQAANQGVQEFANNSIRAGGLTALESGLVGLAVGIPMLFFKEYSESKKGDNQARYMSKMLKRPVEMKDLLDPRDPSNRNKIISQGGSIKNNPIIYLANNDNTNIAAKLHRDKIIATDVYKTIMNIWTDKNAAIKIIKKAKSSSIIQEVTAFGCNKHSLGYIDENGKFLDISAEDYTSHEQWLHSRGMYDWEPAQKFWIKLSNANELSVPFIHSVPQVQLDGLVNMWLQCKDHSKWIKNPEETHLNIYSFDFKQYEELTIPEFIEKHDQTGLAMERFFGALL